MEEETTGLNTRSNFDALKYLHPVANTNGNRSAVKAMSDGKIAARAIIFLSDWQESFAPNHLFALVGPLVKRPLSQLNKWMPEYDMKDGKRLPSKPQ